LEAVDRVNLGGGHTKGDVGLRCVSGVRLTGMELVREEDLTIAGGLTGMGLTILRCVCAGTTECAGRGLTRRDLTIAGLTGMGLTGRGLSGVGPTIIWECCNGMRYGNMSDGPVGDVVGVRGMI
jgi:hypothetical protein